MFEFIKRHKLAIGITAASLTLGTILAASSVVGLGVVLILGGVGGVGYVCYKEINY